MKLLMMIVDSECKEELEVLLERRGVGYTEVPQAHGVGTTGVRMGSSAYPKTSSVFFTVLADDQVGDLRSEITSYCEACERRMKMFVWSAEEVV
jgi:uncharacterized protein YaaQ